MGKWCSCITSFSLKRVALQTQCSKAWSFCVAQPHPQLTCLFCLQSLSPSCLMNHLYHHIASSYYIGQNAFIYNALLKMNIDIE